ncbi:hypothetical protein ABZ215_14445 [Amycolatopsis sp. NPDC006131]|uniref:hypothetical protein n=1 Tax=Amycolatopsis sp. NPDC006131 TaxID=3156731 RepID=UPI0033B71BB2
MAQKHRHWRDLSRTEQGAIVAAATLRVALAADAWWDLSRRPAESVRGPKGAWAMAIAVNFIGPLEHRRFGRKPVVEPEPAHP